jgi:hypothetical protein
MPFDEEAVSALEILGVAEVMEECWVPTDNAPPLALHSYHRVSKGTVIGIIDKVNWAHDSPGCGSEKVRGYVADGNQYLLTLLNKRILHPMGGRHG